ncbi:unnamed protein product [Allacma fusca]|uniref:E3 ubiquitin-protein ligase Sina-like RING finger domain-containing protein n=1 Tax=Allacma fusca TaxID=39272 RepID=A0A8J2LA23_9HEXA|nr:unnamed protein product [Allacma fusca]
MSFSQFNSIKPGGKRCYEESNCNSKDDCTPSVSSKRKLSHVLECPVCTSICQPPIYNCIRGHSVCNDCRMKWKHCGLCKSQMTNSRNFIAEEIVETYKFPCEYEEKGCTARLLGRVYEDHVDKCVYGKSIKCHLSHLDNCNQNSMQYSGYLNHLVLHHKVQELLGTNGTFSVLQTLHDYTIRESLVWKGLNFAFNSKMFFPLTFISSDVLHFTMGILGSDCDAKEYQVKIKLKHPLKLQWVQELSAVTVPVYPLHECNKDWLKPRQTAAVSKFNLQKLCLVDETPTGFSLEWLTHYEIIKVPEP